MRFFVPFRGIDGHTQRDGLGLPPVRETERQRRPAVAIDGVFATYDFDLHAIRSCANGRLFSVKRVKHAVKHRPENPCSVIALRRSVQFLSPRPLSVQMRQLTEYQDKKAVISDCLQSGKRDSNPRCAWVARAVILHPRSPSRGSWGRSPKSPFSFKQKRQPKRLSFPSGKRDSNPRCAWVARAVILHPRSPSRGPWARSPKSPFSLLLFHKKRTTDSVVLL